MRQLAIYGKGGIGKSTLSAHLSAALAKTGMRVIQIGCDPKHDSTRLLTRGKVIPTALDYLRVTNPLDYRFEDVVFEGSFGVCCVEAGGPMPGVGCAGRGIISTFDLLEQFQIQNRFDLALYDVLGDVVCGGFAVPIRSEYADTVLIVTSGGFMSLYAANNILRGVKNYDQERPRVAGILYNRGNLSMEDARVARFAEAVGLPVTASFPRSESFVRAEREGVTLIESGEDEEIAGIFLALAKSVKEGLPCFPAAPLEDEALEQIVLREGEGEDRRSYFKATSMVGGIGAMAGEIGGGIDAMAGRIGAHVSGDEDIGVNAGRIDMTAMAGGIGRIDGEIGATAGGHRPGMPDVSEEIPQENAVAGDDPASARPADRDGNGADDPDQGRFLSKNLIRQEPLHGCAFNGAVSMCLHLMDAVVLAHAPKSCAFLSWQSISSVGRRSLFERGALLPVSLSPNLVCTEMDESDMIFGGMDLLAEKLEEAKVGQPPAIILVSACPAGIIGDDIERFARKEDESGPAVIALKTDGNMTGDYLQGMLMCYTALAREFIRDQVQPAPDTVNIVFEKVVSKNTYTSFTVISTFLSRMDITVGCRFLCETTVEKLKNFRAAPLNLLAYKDYTGRILQDFFEKEFDCRFFEHAFPVGFAETERWLRDLGKFFGKQEAAEQIIAENVETYRREAEKLKPLLQGKKLMVITYNHNLDWILKTSLDVGIVVVKLGILNFSQDAGFVTDLDIPLPIEENYDRENRQADAARLAPDIILSNYEFPGRQGDCIADTIPMSPDVGFFSGVNLAKRWADMFNMNLEGEWRQDESLFKKYYTG